MAEARGRAISSLYGFEAAVNLTRLALSENDISFILELAAFAQLETLVLNDNRISDVSAFAKLTQLETLALRENYGYDVSSGRDIAIHPRDSHILAIRARGTKVQV